MKSEKISRKFSRKFSEKLEGIKWKFHLRIQWKLNANSVKISVKIDWEFCENFSENWLRIRRKLNWKCDKMSQENFPVNFKLTQISSRPRSSPQSPSLSSTSTWSFLQSKCEVVWKLVETKILIYLHCGIVKILLNIEWLLRVLSFHRIARE